MASLLESCLFCKIIKGTIPCFKLLETPKALAFLDINPTTSQGHALVIPKFHAEKLHGLPDDYLTDILPLAAKIARATGTSDFNILQNNGALAHQEIPHVHFHVIPKPNAEEGLKVGWPQSKMSQDDLAALHAKLLGKL